MTAPRIEPLAHVDLDAILVIERAQFDDPWSLQVLRDELDDATRRYTKATVDATIVGYLGLMVVDAASEAHVNSIATASGSEGKGIATALLVEGLRAVAALGISDVTLEVASRNVRAQRLYGRFGFAPVGVRRGYYARSSDDAVVMWVRDIDTAEYRARLQSIEGA